jgi:hypothetical protein
MKTSSDFLNMDWDWRTVQDAYTTIAQIHTFERETDDSFVSDELHRLQKQDQKTKVLQKFQVHILKLLLFTLVNKRLAVEKNSRKT